MYNLYYILYNITDIMSRNLYILGCDETFSLAVTDMDPETGAIDEQVDRALGRDRSNVDYRQVREPPGQRRMIGKGASSSRPRGVR